MSFKIGDKFVIEIDRIYSSAKHEISRYGVMGFGCLVFDDRGLKKLTRLEQITKDDVIQAKKEAYEAGFKAGKDEQYGKDSAAFKDLIMQCEDKYAEGVVAGSKGNETAYKDGMDFSWHTASRIVDLWFNGSFQDANDFDQKLNLDCDPGEDVFRKFFGKYSPQEAAKALDDFDQKAKVREAKKKEIMDRITIDGEVPCRYCEYYETEEDKMPCLRCTHNGTNRFKMKDPDKCLP